MKLWKQLVTLAGAGALLLGTGPALTIVIAALSGAAAAHGMDDAQHASADPHAQHRAMTLERGYRRSEHRYTPPDLVLIDTQGRAVRLHEALRGDRPVLLNFVYTTCPTICPVLSAVFMQVQDRLGPERERVRMISITIDPEHDTPQRLRDYARLFGAGSTWHFLTGERDGIVAVQKAFDAYRGTKANHVPLTFLRARETDPWVRLDGLATASDVVREYRALTAR